MWNMLVRPTVTELASFGEPDFIVINAAEVKKEEVFHAIFYAKGRNLFAPLVCQ